MSQTTHVNYLARLTALKEVADIKGRLALLVLTTAAVVLPVAQVVIPALGQGRILHLGSPTGLGNAFGLIVGVCAALVLLPIVPALSRAVRPLDIAMGAAALILTWMTWSGLGDAQAAVERVAAFGLLVDDTYAPVTSWRWGAPFAVAAAGLAIWRGARALVRPLHT